LHALESASESDFAQSIAGAISQLFPVKEFLQIHPQEDDTSVVYDPVGEPLFPHEFPFAPVEQVVELGLELQIPSSQYSFATQVLDPHLHVEVTASA
jgi:hypothetical protein